MNYQNDSVRRQDRLLDQPEATELLRRGEYGILCMQRPEGGGYGVPLNYVWDEADAIYIHCAPEGRKLHCLRECDRVTFCIVGKTQVLPARFTTFYESILLDCRVSLADSSSRFFIQTSSLQVNCSRSQTMEALSGRSSE